jgi:hypothetical protein
VDSLERASNPRGAALAFLSTLVASTLVAVLAVVRHLPPRPQNAQVPVSRFSAARAREIQARLYSEGVPHTIGTASQKRIRERILEELARMGYAPTLDERFVCSRDAACAQVSNILAELPGTVTGKSVLLAAHYDSVGAGPGASDDGMGVAAILEVARILKSEPPRRNSVMFLIDDGEEAGLLGAEAFASFHPWARRVGAVVNVEARGTSGASLLFETSDDNAWLINLAGSALPHPVTSSVFYTVYKWLPNDTDLTVFKAHGLAGINFACIGSVSHYHTPLDNLANASLATLQHHGENALAMARALAQTDLDAPHRGNAVFFDLLGAAIVRWPDEASVPLAAATVVLIAASIWLRVHRQTLRLAALAWGLVASVAMLLVSVVLGLAAAGLLSAGGALPTRWIAHPLGWIAALWSLPLLGVAGVAALAARRIDPPGVWSAVWLLQSCLALLLAIFAPGLSFAFLVPALLAGLLSIVGARGAVTAPAVLSAFFWLPMAWTLYDGLGTQGTAVIAAMVALFAVTLAPLLAAASIGFRRRVVGTLLASFAIALIVAIASRPFSDDRPERIPIVWYEDGDSGTSQWLVAPESGKIPRELAQAAPFAATSFKPFPWFEARLFAAPAEAPPKADAPEWTVLQESTDSGRFTQRARVRSLRGANVIVMSFSPGSNPLSIRIGGQTLPEIYPRLAKRLSGSREYSCMTVPPEGIEIELTRPAGPAVAFLLADEALGLPSGGERLVAARPRTAVTSQWGDISVVVRRVQF